MKPKLRAYRSIAKTSARQSVAYAGAFALQVVTAATLLVSSLAVWRVILRDGPVGGFAFVSFLPASWLLGREGRWLGLLTPLVAAACVVLTRGVFRAGLRRYDSAGH